VELRQVWISQTFWSRPRTHYRAALSPGDFHVKIRLVMAAQIRTALRTRRLRPRRVGFGASGERTDRDAVRVDRPDPGEHRDSGAKDAQPVQAYSRP